MTDEINAEHAEIIELLNSLCEAVLLPGSHVIDFGPDKIPMIAYYFQGATGVALPSAAIDLKNPVIKELARRAISARTGGEFVQQITVYIDKDKRGRIFAAIERDKDKPRRPVFIDAVYWYGGLADGFKKLNYSDAEIIDGLWQYINNDVTFFLKFFESYYAAEESESIRDKIVLLDSTTSEHSSKWHSVRGVYHKLENMRWADDIIESEEKALGRPLTKEEKIAALARAKEYLDVGPNGDILACSDRWGDFVISATLPIFAEDQNQSRREYLEGRLKEPDLFDNAQIIKQLNEELSRIRLYQHANKVYRMSAVYYFNTRTTQITIPKSEALEYFGWDPEDRAAYAEIKSAAWAIYNASIIIRGSKIHGRHRFWSSFAEDQKNFYIGFLPDLWPATRELVVSYGKERTPEAAEILKNRRYHEFPPRMDAVGLSAYGDFYAGFLFRETGNRKIKDIPDGQKVIARTGADHCAEARIQDSNPYRRMESMIDTWREIMNKTNLITRIEPSIKTLEGLTPGRFSKTQIHVYATKDAAKVNEYLKQQQGRRT